MQQNPLNGIIEFDITFSNKNKQINDELKDILINAGKDTTYFRDFISIIENGEVYFPRNSAIYSFKMKHGDTFAISDIRDDIIHAYIFWNSSVSPLQILSDAIEEIKKRIKQNSRSRQLKIEFNKETKLTLIETSFSGNKNVIEETKHHFVTFIKDNRKLSKKSIIEFLTILLLAFLYPVFKSDNFLFLALGVTIPCLINIFSDLSIKNRYSFGIAPFKSDQSAKAVITPDETTSQELQDPS